MVDEAQKTRLDASVADVVAAERAVLAAWVFGSRARDAEQVTSDLDVAVLMDSGARAETLSRLTAALTLCLGIDVDLVDLAKSTPVLGFEVVAGAVVCLPATH